jgi:hypothetical protein
MYLLTSITITVYDQIRISDIVQSEDILIFICICIGVVN